MKEFLDETNGVLKRVVCNACGKEIVVENSIMKEGCFEANQKFGFFSQKDGQAHSFDLCEECYDNMVANFKIPITINELTELL